MWQGSEPNQDQGTDYSPEPIPSLSLAAITDFFNNHYAVGPDHVLSTLHKMWLTKIVVCE